MKHFILLISFLFIQQIPSLGQSADSLESALKSGTGKEKLELLLKLTEDSKNRKNPSKCIFYSRQALQLAKTLKEERSQGIALKNMGIGFYLQGNYYSALEYYDKALLILEKIGDYLEIANVDNNIGVIYKQKADYYKALEYYHKALQQYEKINDKNKIALALNNIDNIYTVIQSYDKALDNYKRALDIYESLKDSSGIASALNNLGNIYNNLQDYIKAIDYYKKALKMKEALGDIYSVAITLHNIGNISSNLQKYSEALEYYKRALEIEEAIGDKLQIASIYKSIGNTYRKMGDNKNALPYFENSLNIAVKAKMKKLIHGNYLLISETYAAMGDYKSAFEYNKKYSMLTDTIFSEESGKKIAEFQISYETERKEKEYEILEKENEIKNLEIAEQQSLIFFLVTVSILVVVLIIIIYVLYNIKKKNNAELTNKNLQITRQKKELAKINEALEKNSEILHEANASKDKFFSIIAHDLKNPLQAILLSSQLITQQEDRLSEEERHEINKNIYVSSKALGDLLENLLQWARTQMKKIEFNPQTLNMQAIIKESWDFFDKMAQAKGIKLIIDIPLDCYIHADSNMVRSITRNLISNAIKFTNVGGEIKISAQIKGSFLEISIADNGIGIAPENLGKIFKIDETFTTPGTLNEKGTGLGLILSKEFIEKNKGKIRIVSEYGKGSTFIFTLPKQNPSVD